MNQNKGVDMTDLTEFDRILDAAALDPRPRWKRAVAQIVDQGLGGVPTEIAAELRRAPARELASKLKAAIEGGNIIAGDQAIADFETALRKAVTYERQHGRLRPVTPRSELERHSGALVEHCWGPAETDALLQMIRPGEQIKSVEWWKLITSEREIGRGEVRAFGKPVTWTNRHGSWERQFVSDHEVREAEADAAARARAQFAPWAANRNLDLPGGIRS